MDGARKYVFETEFSPDGGVKRDARITPEMLEAERSRAFADGKSQAELEGAAALQQLAQAAEAILGRLDEQGRAMRAEAARIAMVAAKKISGAALDQFGAERAAAAVEAAMDCLRAQPRLVLRLAPQTAAALRPRITEMCESHAYSGAVLIREEQSLGAGDVVIDWADGVVTLNAAEAAERIESMIEAALASPATQNNE